MLSSHRTQQTTPKITINTTQQQYFGLNYAAQNLTEVANTSFNPELTYIDDILVFTKQPAKKEMKCNLK